MASPGVIGSSLSHFLWNPRKSDFFPSFDAEIELDQNVIRPFKSISGKLKLNLTKEIRFNAGIRVQLDANVKLRFQNKVDNRVSTKWAIVSILKDAPDSSDGNYVLSPVRLQILGDEEDVDQKFVLSPGSYEYSFTMSMPAEHLPAPFRSKYGCLQYHVAAYMGSPYCYVQIADQIVSFGGFNDLTQRSETLGPINISSGLHESVFSSKPLITVTLSTEKSGFHPGENIPFTLKIENPKAKTVKEISVKLSRKVTFCADGATKTTLAPLDTFQVETESNEVLLTYTETLVVPKPCIPSYSGKGIYSVKHLIQYGVIIEEHPAVAKGEAEVEIGTTKPSAAMLVNRLQSRRESAFATTADIEPAERQRSYSICSRSAHHPVVVHLQSLHSASRPSSIGGRTMSMHSIQELH